MLGKKIHSSFISLLSIRRYSLDILKMSLSPLPETTEADRWTAEDDIWPTEDDKWTTGDFTLVSSDNVTFRIESFYLYSSRLVCYR